MWFPLRPHDRPSSVSKVIPTCSLPQSSDEKHSHVPMLASHGLLAHTTIIISPLDMAGQPGACIVTAVLQAGFAIVDTTAYGDSEVQTALDTQICSDQEMEARLNRQTFGQFPLPMALCWQRVEESSSQPKLHRLHLVLTEAPRYHPGQKCHPAYPGGSAIGLLWGHALDGEERPVWEVRPYKDGWQLQEVGSGGVGWGWGSTLTHNYGGLRQGGVGEPSNSATS